MGFLFDTALSWLTGKVLEALTALWQLLLQTALTLPDVTALPQVADLTNTSLMIVNTCFVLVIITAGIVVMTRETLQIRYGIAELGPRLVVGFIAANMSTLICTQLITLANALTQALAGENIASAGAFAQLRDTVQDSLNAGPVALLVAIIVTILAVLTALLLVQWIVRLGVLVVLVGIAPIALACHALPMIEGAAKLWWRAMLGTVATVLVQALALHAALSIFLNPKANVAALGLPNDPSRVFNLFIVVCLLYAVLKIPSLMRRYVTKGAGGSGASIGKILIVQQVIRAVSRAVTKVPTRTPGGGAAGARAAGAGRPTPIGGGGRPPRPGGRTPGPAPVGRNTAAGHANGPGHTSSAATAAARPGRPGRSHPPDQGPVGGDTAAASRNAYTPIRRPGPRPGPGPRPTRAPRPLPRRTP